jgi:hypothetical protein
VDREALAELVARTGCTLRGQPGEFDCPDGEAKLRLLDLAATYDARYDSRIRGLAVAIVRDHARTTGALDVARALHAAVKGRVRYLGEGIDTFQSSWQTWADGLGDCDDSARLLLALARSVGLRADMGVLRRPDGQPSHVVALLDDGTGQTTWAECTLDAHFGEHPVAAYARLRARGIQPRMTAHLAGVDMGNVVGDWVSAQADALGASVGAVVAFAGLGLFVLAFLLEPNE